MFRPIAHLLLRIFAWDPKPAGSFPVAPRKYVLIVAPHTSNWDFIIGVLYRSVLEMKKARFLGKKELFKPPFGFLFRWLGGTPVDRKSSHNVVEQVAALFHQQEELIVALSPEGTRKKVDRLRTGFYNIALQAGVPIVMVGFDFGNKRVVFSPPFFPSGNFEKDQEAILGFFAPIKGRNPEKGLSHLLKQKSPG